MAEVDTNTTAAPKREKKVSVDNEKRKLQGF
jgi:hypothetical protein